MAPDPSRSEVDPRPRTLQAEGQDPVAEAIARFQAGVDRQASYEFLVECYYHQIVEFFRKRGAGSPEDCLDLTQETFSRVYTGLKGFRGESRFSTWLFRIADHVRLRHAQRRRSRETGALREVPWQGASADGEGDGLEENVPTLEEDSPLESLLARERKAGLKAAIDELPEQMRKCMVLRTYRELSYQEIAVVMRLSVETVKVHLFRGRAKLEEKLGGERASTPDRGTVEES